MHPIVLILIVTFVAGLFGGYAAFLIDNRSLEVSKDGASFRTVLPYLVLGIIAGACVPLFLSLVQSNLLADTLASLETASLQKLLIYVGLCLIAAIYARKFISSISDQVLAIDKKAEIARIQSEEAREAIEEVKEVVDEQDVEKKKDVSIAPASSVLVSNPNVKDYVFTPTTGEILKSLTTTTFRTATGVAKELGMNRAQIGVELNDLADQGLINRTISPKTGGPRWTINEVGLSRLNEQGSITRFLGQ